MKKFLKIFKHSSSIDGKTKIVLGSLLLVAAFLRFYNSNWDTGNLFHPDERNIANAVSSITLFSQMDPKFYAYGGFLIYLYKFTADLLVVLFNNPSIAHDWGWINVIGRSYSAFFSSLTIFPIYLLGIRLFNKKAALLAALLYTFCVASIQTAHFSTTENLLTLTVISITYLSLLLYEKPSKKLTLLTGLLIGISIAAKTTGIVFFLSPLVALGTLFIKKPHLRFTIFLYSIMMGLTAAAIFSLFSPFTFLNWAKFMESMKYENGVVLGTNRVVYTLQFSHTIPYLFQLKNLFWQLGIFAVVAIVATVSLVWQAVKNRNIAYFLFLSFPLAYFIYVGSWYTKFNRYMAPLLPFLILIGSNLLILLLVKHGRLGKIIIGISVAATILWGLAFFSIYVHKQTRVAASEWIYQNISTGEFILTEHWDEGLPIPLPEGRPDSYRQLSLTIYEADDKNKIDYYANYLSEADYVTINSRRLYGTLMYLPEKYPITKRYYEYLFSGKLGYEKVAEFSSYPSLAGITIPDDASEETFQVYDHPKGLIFKNTKHYTFSEIQLLLQK